MTDPRFDQFVTGMHALQERLRIAQEELARARVLGEAADGLVTAGVTGLGELVEVRIEQGLLTPARAEQVQRLVVAAVRDGMRKAADLAEARMGPPAFRRSPPDPHRSLDGDGAPVPPTSW